MKVKTNVKAGWGGNNTFQQAGLVNVANVKAGGGGNNTFQQSALLLNLGFGNQSS